jgi:hypothetical protein
MEKIINELRHKILKYRFDLYDEKQLQLQMFELVLKDLGFLREFRLDNKSIVDFYQPDIKLALEVKIQGSSMAIYRQIKRYCEFESVDGLVLVSAKAMSLPLLIESKPAYIILLGKSWL